MNDTFICPFLEALQGGKGTRARNAYLPPNVEPINSPGSVYRPALFSDASVRFIRRRRKFLCFGIAEAEQTILRPDVFTEIAKRRQKFEMKDALVCRYSRTLGWTSNFVQI